MIYVCKCKNLVYVNIFIPLHRKIFGRLLTKLLGDMIKDEPF